MRNVERHKSREARSAHTATLAASLQLRAQALAVASVATGGLPTTAYQLLMAAADAERSLGNRLNGKKSSGPQVDWKRRLGMDPIQFLAMVGLLSELNPKLSRLKICNLVSKAAEKRHPEFRHRRGLVRQIKNLIEKPSRKMADALARRELLTPPWAPGFKKAELTAISALLGPEFG